MSNHLISEAYKRQLGSMARNAVMVLLADKASDDGTGIWASKQRMAEEIGTTKQTIITTIKSLIADKLLRESGRKKCPNGYTIEYAINVAALQALPLVNSHQSSRATGKAARPVKRRYATGKAARPKPSGTPLEGLSNDKPTRAKGWPEIPDWMPVEPWNGFIEMRHDKGKDPTSRAVTTILDKLERWRAKGHDPGVVLDTATENKWTTIYEPKDRANDNDIRRGGGQGPDKRSGLARAIDSELGSLPSFP